MVFSRTGLISLTMTKLASHGEYNPILMNGFSHHYQLGESTFIFRGVKSDFLNFIQFFDENSPSKQNSPSGTTHSAASHLGLYCLPMSHKRGARLI